jgi:LytS/YehU family sensor histidine kinase
VEIEDNGCGLPKAQPSAAPVVADEGASPNIRGRFNEGVGIGLATTRSRLERFYPDAHLLQLRDAQKGGLVVILEVPFRTEGNGQGE